MITSTRPPSNHQPGAGGQKGTQEVANAPADGYTLLFTHNYFDQLQQHVVDLPYNPTEDFVTVDAYLVAGGKYHDIDFARLELLTLLGEHEHVRVKVDHDFSDVDSITASTFSSSSTSSCICSINQRLMWVRLKSSSTLTPLRRASYMSHWRWLLGSLSRLSSSSRVSSL